MISIIRLVLAVALLIGIWSGVEWCLYLMVTLLVVGVEMLSYLQIKRKA